MEDVKRKIYLVNGDALRIDSILEVEKIIENQNNNQFLKIEERTNFQEIADYPSGLKNLHNLLNVDEIKTIALNGFNREDIDYSFLDSFNEFTLNIGNGVYDFSQFKNQLVNITDLTLYYSDIKNIDLAMFPNIINLNIFEIKGILNSKKSLDFLTTINIKKTINKDLNVLSFCPNLKSLELIQTGIKSLDGIEKIKNIQKISIEYAKNLENIESIKNVTHSLKNIFFINCKKINSYQDLLDCQNLEVIGIMDSAEIQNLDFLKNKNNLKSFVFNRTNVQNGDLSILAKLKPTMLSFDNKKHYNYKILNPGDKYKLTANSSKTGNSTKSEKK